MNSPESAPVILGNWKMNLGPGQGHRWARRFLEDPSRLGSATVGVFPPFVTLAEVLQAVDAGGNRVGVGAQTCHWEADGAFTGETAPAWLRTMGCRWVLVGHSERRHIFGETREIVRRKLEAALAADLEPVLCVGETLEQRRSGDTRQVLEDQLRSALGGTDPGQAREAGLLLAYEPVWAIGTGETATPDQAEEAHGFLRSVLEDLGGGTASSCPILYGGSVKPENAAQLMARDGVDGALVGGASLDPESFLGVVEAARTAS